MCSYKLGAPLLLQGKGKDLQPQPTLCAGGVLSPSSNKWIRTMRLHIGSVFGLLLKTTEIRLFFLYPKVSVPLAPTALTNHNSNKKSVPGKFSTPGLTFNAPPMGWHGRLHSERAAFSADEFLQSRHALLFLQEAAQIIFTGS